MSVSQGTITAAAQRQGTWDDEFGDTKTEKCSSNLQNCFSARGLNRLLFPSPSSPIEQATCSISPFERAKRLFVVCLCTHLDAKVDSCLFFDLFFSADEAGLVCWLATQAPKTRRDSLYSVTIIHSPLSLSRCASIHCTATLYIFLRPLLTSFQYFILLFFHLSAGRISLQSRTTFSSFLLARHSLASRKQRRTKKASTGRSGLRLNIQKLP